MSDHLDCVPCLMQDILKSATNWCTTCEEGLCDNCNIHHKTNKASRSHTTITFSKLKALDPFVSSIKTTCDVHDKPLELFCPNHEAPCCSSCAAINHATCLGITSFQKVTEEANNSNQIDDINVKLGDLLSQVDVMIKNRKDNKTKILDQAGSHKSKLRELRKNINYHIDVLEKQLQSKSENLISLQTGLIDNVVKRLQIKRHDINNLKNNIVNLKNVGSNAHKYIGGKKVEGMIGEENKILASLAGSLDMSEVNLEFIVDPMIGKTIMKFVDVTMNKDTGNLKSKANVSTCQTTPGGSTILQKTYDTSVFDRGVTISSMIAIPCWEVIVSAYSTKTLVVFSQLGTMKQIVRQIDEPFGLAYIGNDEIAVSFPETEIIKIFNTQYYTKRREIEVYGQCWGIDFANNTLLVAIRYKEILFLDKFGIIIKRVSMSNSNLTYVHMFMDRYYRADFTDSSVHCYSSTGKKIWCFSEADALGTRNMCSDSEGNLFVACQDSNRVILLSKDGTSSKVVVETKEPKAIWFDSKSSVLYVCSLNGNNLSKYRLLT